jgi:UDP-perosamine 4-acetyltransferase
MSSFSFAGSDAERIDGPRRPLPLVIVGAGCHARVLIDALACVGRSVLAALDDDDAIKGYPASDVELVNGVGSFKTTAQRDAIYRRFNDLGYRFARIIHPSAIISYSAVLGDGVQVMAGSVVGPGAAIGVNSIINTRAAVDHDCRIGESVHIAPGATLSGSVSIGDGTHIGTGAVVIQGISIGRRCLIAAGAVVYRDLPDGSKHINGRN